MCQINWDVSFGPRRRSIGSHQASLPSLSTAFHAEYHFSIETFRQWNILWDGVAYKCHVRPKGAVGAPHQDATQPSRARILLSKAKHRVVARLPRQQKRGNY